MRVRGTVTSKNLTQSRKKTLVGRTSVQFSDAYRRNRRFFLQLTLAFTLRFSRTGKEADYREELEKY